MAHRQCFRRVLPVTQTFFAVLLGGVGLWQRNQILSDRHSFGWHSTARFHVWPLPFKFAVISNLPAFMAGSVVFWPLSSLWPELSEVTQLAPCVLFVPILWYWVGSHLDRTPAIPARARVLR